jgi:hypothetical protein
MRPDRTLHHRRRQLIAAQNIAKRYRATDVVNNAQQQIDKIDWFIANYLPSTRAWTAAHIGPNGWGPMWDSIVQTAKFIRRFENERKAA